MLHRRVGVATVGQYEVRVERGLAIDLVLRANATQRVDFATARACTAKRLATGGGHRSLNGHRRTGEGVDVNNDELYAYEVQAIRLILSADADTHALGLCLDETVSACGHCQKQVIGVLVGTILAAYDQHPPGWQGALQDRLARCFHGNSVAAVCHW
jgi:hypothetical protein